MESILYTRQQNQELILRVDPIMRYPLLSTQKKALNYTIEKMN
jgi:hypothetical protein